MSARSEASGSVNRDDALSTGSLPFCSPQGNDRVTCHWRKGRTRARELTLAATNRLDDLPDCVDHKLRLLLVYFVAAVRIRDVLRVEHQVGELLLRFFLRSIGDVAEVLRNNHSVGCLLQSLTGSEGPRVGPRTILREELNAVAQRRELGRDCGPH